MKISELEKLNQMEKENWWYKNRRTVITNFLSNHHFEKILDYGCGTGATTQTLKKFGTVLGTDRSEFALEKANSNGIETINFDSVNSLEFSNNFNLITLFDVLEHIENDHDALLHLNKLLKNQQFILLTVPAFNFLWSDHDDALSHYRRYTKKTLSIVLKNSGFKIIRISYFMTWTFPFIGLYRILTKWKKTESSSLKTLPETLNNLIEKSFSLENNILKKRDLLVGNSLICLAQKND